MVSTKVSTAKTKDLLLHGHSTEAVQVSVFASHKGHIGHCDALGGIVGRTGVIYEG
jgi:hypothetical protein